MGFIDMSDMRNIPPRTIVITDGNKAFNARNDVAWVVEFERLKVKVIFVIGTIENPISFEAKFETRPFCIAFFSYERFGWVGRCHILGTELITPPFEQSIDAAKWLKLAIKL